MIGVLKHSDDYDITSAIELILVNLPNDISIMESIRLIYVRLGRLFSYDYNVASDINIALRKVDFENVSNYQTCTQISEILKACLSYINNTNGFFEENAKPTRIICPELLINTENPPHIT